MGKSAIDDIQQRVRGRMELNAMMSERTTMRTGGAADLLIRPADRDDLAEVLRFLHEREIETMVVGNGSSLIVRDGGFRGALLQLAEGFDTLENLQDEGEAKRFRADAGVSLRRLVRWSVDAGIGGLEYLYGIPGTVGGAIANNAGAWDHEFGDYVVEIETMDRQGGLHRFTREEAGFGYRRCGLPADHVILGAVLQARSLDGEAVKKNIQDYQNLRRQLHPLHEPSAGMIFFNPPGVSAGRLIDKCGLKGVRLGDAEISRLHANFIVNLGHALATQIVSLMGMIQERVYVRYKVRLEPKVKMVGSWQKEKLRIRE